MKLPGRRRASPATDKVIAKRQPTAEWAWTCADGQEPFHYYEYRDGRPFTSLCGKKAPAIFTRFDEVFLPDCCNECRAKR